MAAKWGWRCVGVCLHFDRRAAQVWMRVTTAAPPDAQTQQVEHCVAAAVARTELLINMLKCWCIKQAATRATVATHQFIYRRFVNGIKSKGFPYTRHLSILVEWRYIPVVLKLGNLWRPAVSPTPRPLYPRGECPQHPFNRHWLSPQSSYGRFGRDISCQDGTRYPFAQGVLERDATWHATRFMWCPRNRRVNHAVVGHQTVSGQLRILIA